MHRLYKLILIHLLVLLTGCTIPTTARLYNNAGVTLSIKQISSTNSIKNYILLPDKTIDLEYWESDEFLMSSGDMEWKYNPSMVAAGFTKSYGWGIFVKRITKVQIEVDGSIYLLSVDQEFPATSFVQQPKGFPLQPQPNRYDQKQSRLINHTHEWGHTEPPPV